MTLISIYQIGHWEGSQYTAILQSAAGMSSSSWFFSCSPMLTPNHVNTITLYLFHENLSWDKGSHFTPRKKHSPQVYKL